MAASGETIQSFPTHPDMVHCATPPDPHQCGTPYLDHPVKPDDDPGVLSPCYVVPPFYIQHIYHHLTHVITVTARLPPYLSLPDFHRTCHCPLSTVPVIARLDRAIQKLAQHPTWIIRSSQTMTPEPPPPIISRSVGRPVGLGGLHFITIDCSNTRFYSLSRFFISISSIMTPPILSVFR